MCQFMERPFTFRSTGAVIQHPPEVMAKATEIREFYIDYWPAPANADSDDTLTVTKLCFLDDDGTEYPVDDAVLKAAGNVLKL